MKRIVALLVLLIISPNLSAGGNEEFRATWVITWQLIHSSFTAEQNKALGREILDNHKAANMNAVLWQARQSGTAYYNSSYEPWGYYAGYQNPGYDPLGYAIEEAHKRGMELHAWFNVFSCASMVEGAPAHVHPEWVCRDQDGIPMSSNRALSPGLDSVRAYTINVAMEIVRNYDIDGLHLDYVRWNEYSNSRQSQEFARLVEEQRLLDGMITEAQIQDLIENRSGRYLYDIEHPYSAGVPVGFGTWEEWWRWSVTEFVQVLHDSIQAVKPWVRLSPAALGRYNWGPWQGYGSVYQDAALWFNEGYVDQLTPMHYHWLTGSEFYNMLAGGTNQSWEPWIQTGIDAGRLYSVGPGSYRFADQGVWYRHPAIVEACRNVPWVDGFQFFSYGSWDDYHYWEEAGASFFNLKTKIRDTQLITDIPPEAPTVNLLKIDSLNYEITVTPPDTIGNDYWFALYRSPDEVINVDNDEIIDVHFGDSTYLFIDSFTGTQDYNGTYFYSATMLDRYWNESDPSNVVETDSIPSFPPTVVSTIPAEGDTVPVNTPVVITFSKTMDITSLVGVIFINPEISITQLNWSDDHKTMTIVTGDNFEFATDYTITINSTATDINGRPIDGNGDGIGGDAFELHFRTKDVDDEGPVVIFSYPDYNAVIDSFEVDEVITFLFDEIVDPNSLTDTSVVLTQNGNGIPEHHKLTTVNNRSVLSVQSLEPLENDTEYSILLRQEITDTLTNQMDSDISVVFRTSPWYYTEITVIEPFFSTNYWRQPDYSGSTHGIYVPNTVFGMSTEAYLPASPPPQRRSASLRYEWDESDPPFLIRIYLAEGPPRDVVFDTTYILQVYVFGDGSNNKFRFCVDDSTMDSAKFHEVSKWTSIDWYGWQLVEWKLNDPNSVGEWLGDGALNGPLRFDSFQLTHEIGTAVSGKIYFDELRLVKKSLTGIAAAYNRQIPDKFVLYQNYPNPFNPETKIAFDIPEPGPVQLIVYDLLGREVTTLINRRLSVGHFEVLFDGSGLASGVYFYRLTFNKRGTSRRMLLLK